MKSIVVNVILAMLLLGSGSMIFVAKNTNDNLDRDLIATRSKNDSLSKDKESLGNEVKKLNEKRDSLVSKNVEMNKLLAETTSNLAVRDRQIGRTQKATEEANKKYNALMATNKDLEKQLASLKKANAQLGEDNKSMTSKILLLTDDNKKLNDQLILAKATSKDNVLIETMTKNGTLNLKGKKVKKITASFTMQGKMQSPTFKMFDPNGTQLPDQSGSFDLKTSPGDPLKMELTYLLSKRIGPGLYRIEVLNENQHMGNLLVRFR
jgi:cell division protein FtsB